MDNMSTRVARIIKGNINALIDAAEGSNPAIIAKQTIREIEGVARENKLELGRLELQKRNLQEGIASSQHEHTELLNQIKIAIKEGREDLAEAGIQEQMSIEKSIEKLKEQLKSIEVEIKKHEGFLDALQTKKAEIEKELERFTKAGSSSMLLASKEELSDAEKAFHRVMGADTSPISEEKSQQQNKLAELGSLSKDASIQKRLEAIKAAMNE
jgi:phage shock protein A